MLQSSDALEDEEWEVRWASKSQVEKVLCYLVFFNVHFIMMKIYHRPVPNSPCRIVEDTEYGLFNSDHTFHQCKYVMEVLVRFSVCGSDG